MLKAKTITRRGFTFALFGTVAGGPPAASAQEPDRAIPITISDYRLPFATVQVNGRPATALIDTGSVRAVQLSSRLQRELGLRADTRAGTNQRYDSGGRAVFAGIADEFVLGPYRSAAEPVQVIPGDIEQIEGQVGTTFDVILGWPLLSRFDFAIDYRARLLRLEATDNDRSSTARIAIDPGKTLPVVAAQLGGVEILLLVDSGAPMSNLDITATSEPPGKLIAQTLDLAGRTLPLEFRVKDLTAIRRALGCRAVLGNNFLAGWTLAYLRQSHSFALS